MTDEGRAAMDRALEKANHEADLASLRNFHDSMVEVSKGSVERAQAGAESVRNAAAAVGVIYSAVLGVAFSTDKPLPPRGLIPAVFLGLSIVLATFYVAFLTKPPSRVGWPTDGVSLREDQEARTTKFVEWVRQSVMNRSYALRAAVISLGLGVAFLPVGFLAIGTADARRDATDWPPVPTEGSNIELQKILYQAQVEETAVIRTEQLAPSATESWDDVGVQVVYASAFATFVLMWIIAGIIRGGKQSPGAEPDVEEVPRSTKPGG